MYARGVPSCCPGPIAFIAFSSCLLSLSNSVWMADQSLMCILFCAAGSESGRCQRT